MVVAQVGDWTKKELQVHSLFAMPELCFSTRACLSPNLAVGI